MVSLPEPLVGFTRTHEAQCVLAVFNLSDRLVPLDLAAFGPLTMLEESGFEEPGHTLGCHSLGGHGPKGYCLGPFGAIFAQITGGWTSLPEALTVANSS
jgi:hypothetical protein